MRVETWYGNHIVCGHIFKVNEIEIGSRWQSSGGNIVTVESIDSLGWVKYSWGPYDNRQFHEKESFAFQCRYCLIVEEGKDE